MSRKVDEIFLALLAHAQARVLYSTGSMWAPGAICWFDRARGQVVAPDGKVTILPLTGDERDPRMVEWDRLHIK